MITRFVLLGIYLVFFVVQVFCNAGSDRLFSISANTYLNKKTGPKEKLTDTQTHHNKKSDIRLNKRFQPAIVADITYIPEELPAKYITRNNPVKPKDYLLISFILTTSLRGPPCQADLTA